MGFQSLGGDKSTWIEIFAQNLTRAFELLQLGLAIGIGALVAHRWLFARCESLDREMKNATLWLANELSRLEARGMAS